MASSRVPVPALLELTQRLPLRPASGEERPVHILGGEAPRATHDDGSRALGPREHCPRSHSQASPDLGGHGDLALGGELGVCNGGHRHLLPRQWGKDNGTRLSFTRRAGTSIDPPASEGAADLLPPLNRPQRTGLSVLAIR
jgi:hypothetical protein